MSIASRRRTRQRLAEIALGVKAENLDATTSGSDLEEGDGMSRLFYDNLPSKDIKHRVGKPLGSPMQTEGMANDAARASGQEAALAAAIAKVKAESALRKDPPFWLKEDIGRCQCTDCDDHCEGCSHPASFRVGRLDEDITVCSDCLRPTDTTRT